MHHHLKSTTLTLQPHNRSPPLFPNLCQTTCLQRRRRRHPGRTVMGGIRTCRLVHLLSTVCPYQIWQIGVLLHILRAGIGIVANLAADTTDPLGALEPLVPCLLADVSACGSTLLPGWSSVATTRTAATALTIAIFPRSPPSFCLLLLTFPHSSRRRPLFPPFVPEARKAVLDVFDDFPSFKRSYRARNSVRCRSMVSFSFSLSRASWETRCIHLAALARKVDKRPRLQCPNHLHACFGHLRSLPQKRGWGWCLV